MGFDDNDWGTGSEQGLNLAPTEEKGEIVIDINSPETITSQLRKGLNNTPTRIGFYDGTQWTNYLSSDGKFKVGNGSTGIEYDPVLDETTFTGTINASKLGAGTTLEIPMDYLGNDASITFVGDVVTTNLGGVGNDIHFWNSVNPIGGSSLKIGEHPTVGTNNSFHTIDIDAFIAMNLKVGANPQATQYGEMRLGQGSSRVLVRKDTDRYIGVLNSFQNTTEDGTYITNDKASFTDTSLWDTINPLYKGSICSITEWGFGIAKTDNLFVDPIGLYNITNNFGVHNTVNHTDRAQLLRPDDRNQLWLSNGNTLGTNLWDLNAVMVEVPNTSISTGLKSQLSHDDDYLYVCTSDNTWKRVALSTW